MKKSSSAVGRGVVLAPLVLAGLSGADLTFGCSNSFTSCEANKTCSPPSSGDAGAAGSPSNGAAGADESAGAAGSDAGQAGASAGRDSGGGSTSHGGDGGDGGTSGDDGAGAAGSSCGNGKVDAGEECDQGAANSSNAYGPGLCTNQCKNAPYCGDGIKNGSEACDNGATGATDLGACNPECTGYYEKKLIKGTVSVDLYSTNLGGIVGADAKCVTNFGAGWKALLVGATRRATVTPLLGDQQLDWVIQKYRYYYNYQNELIWRTDDIALLGVRDATRQDTYADAYPPNSNYPWSGYAADWTTYGDNGETPGQGTCFSWTSATAGSGSFVTPDLMPSASELCGAASFILCVEQ